MFDPMTFDHGTFIIAAYAAAAVILAWCALAPVLRARKVRAHLQRVLSVERSGGER